MFSKHITRATCAEIIHPWNKNCLKAHHIMFQYSCVGNCKLVTPIILIRHAIKLQKEKKLDKEFFRDFLIDFFQLFTMTVCLSTSSVVFNCIFRYIMGKYTYSTIAFLPGVFSGLSYVLLSPKSKVQVIAALSNIALETIVLRIIHSGLIVLNTYSETAFFMMINACLMYAFKTSKSELPNYTWFFKPDNNGLSDDDRFVLRNIIKKTRQYVGLGIGFGILSKLFGDITVLAPKNIHKLFKKKTLKPGIFAGSYVAIYELIVYALNRYFQKDQAIFALPAGFLAGLSYAIEPNLSINLSAFINLSQLMYKLIDIRLLRKYISMDTILFCLFTGTLFHYRLFYPKSTSKLGSKFIKMGTGGRYWLRSVGPQVVSVHGLPRRTNNNIESFHNSLKLKFSVNHPCLWIFLDHLTKLSVNYHIIVQQLRNNLRPTRHLRFAFLSNSRRNATEQFDLGLISIWQYLQQCSYTSAEYEQRQRNWALRNPNDEDDELPDEEPNGVIVMDHLLISPNVGINIPIDNVVPHINPPKNDEERSLCMVCMVMTVSNSNAQYIVLPCGHAWVCDTCIVQLEGPNYVCPLYLAMQISFQRIFFRESYIFFFNFVYTIKVTV